MHRDRERARGELRTAAPPAAATRSSNPADGRLAASSRRRTGVGGASPSRRADGERAVHEDECGSQTKVYVPSLSVTVQFLSYRSPRSRRDERPPGRRDGSCGRDWSSTTSVYVPGSRLATRAPDASVSVIVKPSPGRRARERRAGGTPPPLRPRATERRSSCERGPRTPTEYDAAARLVCSGAQLGAEALGERVDDPLAQDGGVLVGERPLGRLEGDRKVIDLPAPTCSPR